jgi:hypothetical protein
VQASSLINCWMCTSRSTTEYTGRKTAQIPSAVSVAVGCGVADTVDDNIGVGVADGTNV